MKMKEIEEIKITAFVDIMKEEMKKSLGNMAAEIETVKMNITKQKANCRRARGQREPKK